MGVIVGERMKCGGEWWGIFLRFKITAINKAFNTVSKPNRM
jgi:hypothetical protein